MRRLPRTGNSQAPDLRRSATANLVSQLAKNVVIVVVGQAERRRAKCGDYREKCFHHKLTIWRSRSATEGQ